MRVFAFACCFAAGVLVGACASPEAANPEIIIAQSEVLEGEAPDVRITGLAPGQSVDVTLERNRGRTELSLYRSEAVFVADESGEVEIFADPPVTLIYGNTYQPSDLFSSMQKVDVPPVEGRSTRTIKVVANFEDEAAEVLSADFNLVREYEGLRTIEGIPGLTGAFLMLPEGEGPFPALILMGGSEGHDSAARGQAPRWASRGYAALGLPYYSPAWGDQPQRIPGLPRAFANIPLDKVETAKTYLCEQEAVSCDRIGLWGVSKGAEMALAAAERIEGFAAVAAIVPSDVIWEGWGAGETVSSFSWRGEPLAFVPYAEMEEHWAKLGRGEESYIRIPHDKGRIANPDRVEAAKIDVNAIDEPVFLVGGDEDKVWASGPMTRFIKAQRDAAGLDTVAFVSEEAGHYLSGDAYPPLAEAEAMVRRDSFPALVAFYERTLKPDG